MISGVIASSCGNSVALSVSSFTGLFDWLDLYQKFYVLEFLNFFLLGVVCAWQVTAFPLLR